ncbi:MAG: class I SAM-dependent methyltransferase [Chloroflexota bacterium]
MVCPHCQDAEDVFSYGYAKRDLENYRTKGATSSTQRLLDALLGHEIAGKTLLDIGGGVGVIQHELLDKGLAHATDVDASSAYIIHNEKEAQRRGHANKIRYVHGDFVQLAPDIDRADIVTLDRVVCCYPDVEKLVDLSSRLANDLYALVYPVDNWLTRNGIHVFNFLAFRLGGSQFRTYVHDSTHIDRIITDNGFQQLSRKRAGFWQVFLYQRVR